MASRVLIWPFDLHLSIFALCFFHYWSWIWGGGGRTTHAVYKQSGDEQISAELGPGQCLQTRTNQRQRRLRMRLDGPFTRALVKLGVGWTFCRLESGRRVSNREPVWCVHRVDSDHYEVSVGAAAEGRRVLPTVSEPRLQLSSAGHAR